MLRGFLLVALVLILAGCADGPLPKPSGVTVSGKVLLPNGSPLAGGLLVLRPEGGIHGASGPIQSDGSFTLADQSGDKTVVPGKYKAFVRFPDPAQQALAKSVNQKYQSTEDGDSDIVVEIKEAKSDLVIQLKK